MKILNKTKALSAPLSQLLNAQDFLEKLVRLREKADDWDEHKDIVIKHFDNEHRTDIAEGLKTITNNTLEGKPDPSSIQYFRKIDTEDALARGFITPPITQEQVKKVEEIIEKGEPLAFGGQYVTPNQCASIHTRKGIEYRCEFEKDHKDKHFARAKGFDTSGFEYVQWNEYFNLPDSLKGCESIFYYDKAKDYLLHCQGELNHPDHHYCKVKINDNGILRDELVKWDIGYSDIEQVIIPTSDKDPSFSRPSEQTALSNAVVALAVCNKTYQGILGNTYYCLDEIGHQSFCGNYNADTIATKLQERLEKLNKDYQAKKEKESD